MIHMTKCVWGFVSAVCLMGLVSVTHVEVSGAAEPQAGAWSGGAAIGFLGNTPDGTAFATNVHADHFLNRQISVGPLAPQSLAVLACYCNTKSCPLTPALLTTMVRLGGVKVHEVKVGTGVTVYVPFGTTKLYVPVSS